MAFQNRPQIYIGVRMNDSRGVACLRKKNFKEKVVKL